MTSFKTIREKTPCFKCEDYFANTQCDTCNIPLCFSCSKRIVLQYEISHENQQYDIGFLHQCVHCLSKDKMPEAKIKKSSDGTDCRIS